MSNIEWTGPTWNPIVGCSKISPGCANCYAIPMAARLEAISNSKKTKNPGRTALYRGLTKNNNWTGQIRLSPEAIDIPYGWKKPRLIFVNSMSDLFHHKAPKEAIDKIFEVMTAVERHRYQILTKRFDGAFDYLSRVVPMPHVWVGFSVTTQDEMDRALPILANLKALGWNTWISAEPLLEHVEATSDQLAESINWIVVGGESGPRSRLFKPSWLRGLLMSSTIGGVPVFVKQIGSNPDDSFGKVFDRKGSDPDEWPKWARVRQFPEGMMVGGAK